MYALRILLQMRASGTSTSAPARARLSARQVRRLQPRAPGGFLLQAPRLLPVLWRPPDDRVRGSPGRSCPSCTADPSMGAHLPLSPAVPVRRPAAGTGPDPGRGLSSHLHPPPPADRIHRRLWRQDRGGHPHPALRFRAEPQHPLPHALPRRGLFIRWFAPDVPPGATADSHRARPAAAPHRPARGQAAGTPRPPRAQLRPRLPRRRARRDVRSARRCVRPLPHCHRPQCGPPGTDLAHRPSAAGTRRFNPPRQTAGVLPARGHLLRRQPTWQARKTLSLHRPPGDRQRAPLDQRSSRARPAIDRRISSSSRSATARPTSFSNRSS